MKKLLLVYLLFFMFFSCSEKKHTGFTVKGKIEGGAGKMIRLDRLTENKVESFDSTIINENNEFIFQNIIHQPDFFLLKLDDNNFIYLVHFRVTCPDL